MSKITFKYFLMNEAGNYKRQELTPDRFVDLMKQSASGWIKYVRQHNSIPIWRGDHNHTGTISFGDSNSFTRSAANTANWYALWIDNSRKWKDFPKRTKSYICTNEYNVADGYGDIHVVIPLDPAHIGVVPKDDMWMGFSKQIGRILDNDSDYNTVETFQDIIRTCSRLVDRSIDSVDVGTMYSDLNHISLEAMEAVIHKVEDALNAIQPGLFNKLYKSDNYSSFDKAAKEAPEEAYTAVKNVWGGGRFNPLRDFWQVFQDTKKIIAGMRKYGLRTLANVFDEVFEPVGFRQFRGSELASQIAGPGSPGREIWVQGPCLFINAHSDDTKTINTLAELMAHEFGIDILQLME